MQSLHNLIKQSGDATTSAIESGNREGCKVQHANDLSHCRTCISNAKQVDFYYVRYLLFMQSHIRYTFIRSTLYMHCKHLISCPCVCPVSIHFLGLLINFS